MKIIDIFQVFCIKNQCYKSERNNIFKKSKISQYTIDGCELDVVLANLGCTNASSGIQVGGGARSRDRRDARGRIAAATPTARIRGDRRRVGVVGRGRSGQVGIAAMVSRVVRLESVERARR